MVTSITAKAGYMRETSHPKNMAADASFPQVLSLTLTKDEVDWLSDHWKDPWTDSFISSLVIDVFFQSVSHLIFFQ